MYIYIYINNNIVFYCVTYPVRIMTTTSYNTTFVVCTHAAAARWLLGVSLFNFIFFFLYIQTRRLYHIIYILLENTRPINIIYHRKSCTPFARVHTHGHDLVIFCCFSPLRICIGVLTLGSFVAQYTDTSCTYLIWVRAYAWKSTKTNRVIILQ